MQISMEILSQMITRTDSGTNARQRSKSNIQDSLCFNKAMAEAMAGAETQPMITDEKPDTSVEENETAPPKSQKHEKDTNAYETIVAGAMGNQSHVVFILEGDMESATTPDINVNVTMPDELGAIEGQTDTETEPKAAVETGFEPITINNEDTDTAADTIGTMALADTSEAIKRAKNAGTTSVKVLDEPEAENTQDAAKSVTGEVTARMPVTGTSERQENEDSSTDFSSQDNLSPLENENDSTSIKGSKEKGYSEVAKAARDAAKGVPESANNPPMPLAEGIKPEKFRADQQMRQTTLEAPVKAENLFEEMVSRIETMKTESQNTMSIQLKPEFLGKVALEIAMDAAGLHVKINAADSGVRTMINGQINALIESLENKGIEVVEVEVAYTGVDNGTFKESREDQSQSNHSRRSYRETETVDGATYYPTLPFEALNYYLDSGVSSVEYRA